MTVDLLAVERLDEAPRHVALVREVEVAVLHDESQFPRARGLQEIRLAVVPVERAVAIVPQEREAPQHGPILAAPGVRLVDREGRPVEPFAKGGPARSTPRAKARVAVRRGRVRGKEDEGHEERRPRASGRAPLPLDEGGREEGDEAHGDGREGEEVEALLLLAREEERPVHEREERQHGEASIVPPRPPRTPGDQREGKHGGEREEKAQLRGEPALGIHEVVRGRTRDAEGVHARLARDARPLPSELPREVIDPPDAGEERRVARREEEGRGRHQGRVGEEARIAAGRAPGKEDDADEDAQDDAGELRHRRKAREGARRERPAGAPRLHPGDERMEREDDEEDEGRIQHRGAAHLDVEREDREQRRRGEARVPAREPTHQRMDRDDRGHPQQGGGEDGREVRGADDAHRRGHDVECEGRLRDEGPRGDAFERGVEQGVPAAKERTRDERVLGLVAIQALAAKPP